MSIFSVFLFCPTTLLNLSYVGREMKRQLIAFSDHTLIFLRGNVLLSLRPPQNEVHPRYGGAHSGGHTGATAWAEESHHTHLLWYDAVRAQLQPRAHIWKGKKLSQKFNTFLSNFTKAAAGLLWHLWWVWRGVSNSSLLVFAVWERADKKIRSSSRRRPRGWAVQSPAGENVRQGSRSNGKKNLFLFCKLSKWYNTVIKSPAILGNGELTYCKIVSETKQRPFWLYFWKSPQVARRTSQIAQLLTLSNQTSRGQNVQCQQVGTIDFKVLTGEKREGW